MKQGLICASCNDLGRFENPIRHSFHPQTSFFSHIAALAQGVKGRVRKREKPYVSGSGGAWRRPPGTPSRQPPDSEWCRSRTPGGTILAVDYGTFYPPTRPKMGQNGRFWPFPVHSASVWHAHIERVVVPKPPGSLGNKIAADCLRAVP